MIFIKYSYNFEFLFFLHSKFKNFVLGMEAVQRAIVVIEQFYDSAGSSFVQISSKVKESAKLQDEPAIFGAEVEEKVDKTPKIAPKFSIFIKKSPKFEFFFCRKYFRVRHMPAWAPSPAVLPVCWRLEKNLKPRKSRRNFKFMIFISNLIKFQFFFARNLKISKISF